MLKSALFYHPLFLEHLTGFGHPEKPERLIAILDCLKEKEIFSEVKLLEPEPASFEELSKVHPAYYLNYLEERVEEGGYLDADTVVSLKSFRVACLAAGAVIRAIDKILDGEIKNAFCLVRPPGHHALSEQAMGFCLLNNLAVGARYALEERNLKKILIFDWDAHHGNGLQDIFYADSSVLYISLHQMPLYPGTGHFDEVGEGKGKGFTVNVPLPAGSGDDLYIYILKKLIEPVVEEFSPDLIMIAAGYDGHFADPLTQLDLTVEGYAKMTKEICNWASKFSQGRLLISLEGGYNLKALSYGVLATINVMANLGLNISEPLPVGRHGCGKPLRIPQEKERERVSALFKKAHSKYWQIKKS